MEYVTLSELFWSIMTNATSGVLLFLFIFRFIFESIRTTVFDR